MTRSTRCWRLLLVTLLVFTQQMGVAHLTTHAAERLRDHQGTALTEDGSCAKCALYASLGSAPLSSIPTLAGALAQLPFAMVAAKSAEFRTLAVYQSRAPPTSL